jgi:hypothetical protein
MPNGNRRVTIMMTRLLLGAGLAVLLGGPALAQAQPLSSAFERVQSAIGAPRGPGHADGSVRVQSSISYFVPLAGADEAVAETEREKARKTLYAMASRECASLLETLAKECRLVNLNSNINAARPYNQAQPNGFTVTGTMTFQIVPK